MDLDVKQTIVCPTCGTKYTKYYGNFYKTSALTYLGIGYILPCKKCVDFQYEKYLKLSGDLGKAIRQVCRKFDLYWDEKIFNSVMETSTPNNAFTKYLSKLATQRSFIGKSYDDTLNNEGSMWTNFDPEISKKVTNKMITFWGGGYTDEMYVELEKRRNWYMSKLPPNSEIDAGTEALLRQICNLEVSINRDQACGKPIVNSVNALNTLLGSLNLKPIQKKDDSNSNDDNTPFGVWVKKWEDDRPIPEVDKDLEDVDNIKKYITVWFLGHLCKMLGVKNKYSRLYDEEIDKYRVKNPKYENETDDEILYDELGDNNEP